MNPIYVKYTEVIPLSEFEIRRALSHEYNVTVSQINLKAENDEITAEIRKRKEIREF